MCRYILPPQVAIAQGKVARQLLAALGTHNAHAPLAQLGHHLGNAVDRRNEVLHALAVKGTNKHIVRAKSDLGALEGKRLHKHRYLVDVVERKAVRHLLERVCVHVALLQGPQLRAMLALAVAQVDGRSMSPKFFVTLTAARLLLASKTKAPTLVKSTASTWRHSGASVPERRGSERLATGRNRFAASCEP